MTPPSPPSSASHPAAKARAKDGETAWLTGLRGLASLAVFFSHLAGALSPDLLFAYGRGISPSTRYSVLKLPLVRLAYGGASAVGVFFVVSGSVVSYTPLRWGRERGRGRLASSVLRRAGRLLVPALASSFAVMLLAQLGAFEGSLETTPGPGGAGGVRIFAVTALRRPTLGAQLGDWAAETAELLAPWETRQLTPPDLRYGVQLWTIPLELWASFVLHLHLLALGRLRPAPRRVLVGVSMAYYFAYGRWDVFLFLAGMALTDVQLVSRVGAAKIWEPPFAWAALKNEERRGRWKSTLRNSVAVLALIVGLYLLSQPDITIPTTTDKVKQSRLRRVAESFVPPALADDRGRLYIAIGAPIVLYAMESGPAAVRWICNTRVAQYLGSISFALYLVHNAVIRSIGVWMLRSFWNEAEGSMHHLGPISIACATLSISLLAADFCYRLVDRPTNRLMKRIVEHLMLEELA